MNLLRNLPPQPGEYDLIDAYSDKVFSWASELKNPARQLREASEAINGKRRRHPLGFEILPLTDPIPFPHPGEGPDLQLTANCYPPGIDWRHSAHNHLFFSRSFVARGTVINSFHRFNFSEQRAPGEGAWRLYRNPLLWATGESIVEPTDRYVGPPVTTSTEHNAGDSFMVRKVVDYHSITVPSDEGAITLFCRTGKEADDVSMAGYRDQVGYIIQADDQPLEPMVY